MARPDQRSKAAEAYRRWYWTPRWRALRDAQLASEPLCQACNAKGRLVPATVCDHVEPHRGNEIKFWSGPFQSLCQHCHDRDKQGQERRGYSVEIDPDGWPVDPRHPSNR